MVLSIISTIFAIPLAVFGGLAMGGYRVILATRIFGSLQLLIALAQAIVAIMASAFSCRVVCKQNRKTFTIQLNPQQIGSNGEGGEASPMNQQDTIPDPPSYDQTCETECKQ